MIVYSEGKWLAVPASYYRCAGECRIEVRAMWTVRTVSGLYFHRNRDVRLVRSYLRAYRLRDVVRKIMSRLQERVRNEKVASIGVGVIIEGHSAVVAGTPVIFIAPCHPKCVSEICLPIWLINPLIDAEWVDEFRGLAYRGELQASCLPDDIVGWSPYSGFGPLEVSDEVWHGILNAIRVSHAGDSVAVWRGEDAIVVRKRMGTRESGNASSCTTVVLFGYGQYAKTNIIPRIPSGINLACIHEVDPTQMRGSSRHVKWSAAPVFETGEKYDICIVAGYHHSHADIAVEAIERGCSAIIIEKPVCTSMRQWNNLKEVLNRFPGVSVYCGFQKRYSKFTTQARSVLGSGVPVSYQCIVYEVPLPERHWYRWPCSGSRLLSNGCHWIDHFLFVNDFSPVTACGVHRFSNATINVWMELENGADMTMTLTERGSGRVGMWDHVELRSDNCTVTIENDSVMAIDGVYDRSVERGYSRSESYERMYDNFFGRIQSESGGDSFASIEASSLAVLELERQVRGLVFRGSDNPKH